MEYKFMAKVRKIGITTLGISIPIAMRSKGIREGMTYQVTIAIDDKEKK